MKRLKSVDLLRGLSMVWMFIAHLLAWWIKDQDRWIYLEIFNIFDAIGATAFLFVAGISSAVSYRNRMNKAAISEDYTENQVKNEYFFKTFFLFIIAMIYNTFIAIAIQDLTWIWTWFILLTITFSLIIAWPFLKTRKSFRIILGVIFWVIHFFLLNFLSEFEGDLSFFGILFYILYNTPSLDPIIPMFPFFLFGTVLGEVLYDIYTKENQNLRKIALKRSLLCPLIILGSILIIFGIFFNFPEFPRNRSVLWLIYSLGIDLILISIFIFFEEFVFYNIKKSYKFLFYYSYYSLVIYLAHNPLYFLFSKQFSIFEIWFFIAATFLIIGFIFRFVYKKWGYNASLKIQLGRLASGIAKRIEYKKNI